MVGWLADAECAPKLLSGLITLAGWLRGGGLCGTGLDPPFDFINEHRDGQDSVKHDSRDEHPFVLRMILIENGCGHSGGIKENHISDGDNVVAGRKRHSLALVMTNGEQVPANFQKLAHLGTPDLCMRLRLCCGAAGC